MRRSGMLPVNGLSAQLPVARSLQIQVMLHYAIIFFVIALIAAVLGFGGVTGVAMEVGRILCILFVILAVISLFRGRTPRA